jgi:hypothetical protein
MGPRYLSIEADSSSTDPRIRLISSRPLRSHGRGSQNERIRSYRHPASVPRRKGEGRGSRAEGGEGRGCSSVKLHERGREKFRSRGEIRRGVRLGATPLLSLSLRSSSECRRPRARTRFCLPGRSQKAEAANSHMLPLVQMYRGPPLPGNFACAANANGSGVRSTFDASDGFAIRIRRSARDFLPTRRGIIARSDWPGSFVRASFLFYFPATVLSTIAISHAF